MADEKSVDQVVAIHRLGDTFVRRKIALFAILAVFFLASFNGQWIVERDTSLFRGLGHALATGKGYVFGDFATRMTYPGLPLMLAGLEKIFGETALPAIVLMNAMALGILVLTYRLVSMHYPTWVAVAVTFGVGMNAALQQLSQELMSDVPFLLGVMLVLYGWERLRLATTGGERWRAAAYLLPGAILAILMRPTFWILAVAWIAVCAWGLLRGPRRAFYAICLAGVIAVALAWFFIDPRTRGFSPLAGGYERDFVAALNHVGTLIKENFPDLLRRQMAALFFGGRFGPVLTQLAAVFLIGGSIYVLFKRGHTLWGLMVVVTLLVTLAIETVPRYYLMILPLLMVGYVLVVNDLSRRAGRRWADAVFAAGVALLMAPNIARSVSFVYQQQWDDPGKRKTWADVLIAAELVKQHVPEGAKVIGPAAPIISYLSGKQVYMQREVLPADKGSLHYPRYIARKEIEYAIFPPSLYRGSEPAIAQMMDHGVIVPTDRIAREGGVTLAKVRIDVPEGHWRNNPVQTPKLIEVTTRRAPPTSSHARRIAAIRKKEVAARRERLAAAERAASRARRAAREKRAMELAAKAKRDAAREARERRERAEAKARRMKREAAARRAATQESATQPATQPAAVGAPVSMRLLVDERLVVLDCAR